MIKIDQYTALHLEVYNGTYFVVQGYAKDDVFKPSWITTGGEDE